MIICQINKKIWFTLLYNCNSINLSYCTIIIKALNCYRALNIYLLIKPLTVQGTELVSSSRTCFKRVSHYLWRWNLILPAAEGCFLGLLPWANPLAIGSKCTTKGTETTGIHSLRLCWWLQFYFIVSHSSSSEGSICLRPTHLLPASGYIIPYTITDKFLGACLQ